MCQKIPYKTKRDAMKDSKRIRSVSKYRSKITKKHSRGNLAEKLKAYECYCGMWHLTSKK